ncbi:MAG: CoA transferase [Pseudomonadota bacterium]
MPASTLLSDVKIADMSTVIFGPYCTQTLADMGADVVKIEPAKGDDFRNVGKSAKTRHMGPGHMMLNRGKRSVVWDLKSEQGKQAVRALIAESDVFIHNVRAGAIDRLGLDFEAVKAIKPDIVYVHCVGFGSDGPYAGRPAYDDLIQGLSGAASLLPKVDGNPAPRFLPTAFADKVSGLHAAYATLAALHHRDRTGEPVHVEVPMFEAITHFLLEEHFYEALYDPPVGPFCYQRQVDPSRQPLQTKDGYIVIAPYTDPRWVRLFDVLNAAHELEDDRLSDYRGRYFNMAYMLERVQHYLPKQTNAHWLAAFSKADIPAAPVNDFPDLQSDPHLQATGFFKRRDHPTEGPYWETQPPVRFHGVAEKQITPARLIGEDTEAVLAQLGLAEPTPLSE